MKCTKQYRLSYTEKAKELVSKMTLEQKISLMGGNDDLKTMMEEALDSRKGGHYNIRPYPAGGIDEIKLPAMKFVDGPRGVVCGNGQTTCFPVSMCRGATFDTELEERVGQIIGEETRAFGGNTFAGVCINLPYNPGWGRSQETYGEESFHIGQMGASLVRGVQEKNVMACIKHFAFNQMENSRFQVNVECDKRTEREVFLPHFKDCIDAGAASVMSAYNLYKDTQCGHNRYLLNKVLKKEWDFDGYVMSDFIWGVKDTVEAANGGQDMEMCCTQFFGEKLVQAVRDGFVKEETIDEAAIRIVRTILAFTEADNEQYSIEKNAGTPEHIAVAREVAEKGITLIKNSKEILPLCKRIERIAVIGKLGNKGNIGDYGSSRVFPAYIVTPLEGIKKTAPDAQVLYCDGSNAGEAEAAARIADVVIFVTGYDHDDEGEFISTTAEDNYTEAMGGDRKNLGLHTDEIELIRKLAPLSKKSVVVLIGGNMITVKEWQDEVDAILMAYYPGQEGGTAIARILFGDVNPSGKLPFVIPEDDRDLPQVDWDTDYQWYKYYHGYTKLEKEGIEPLYSYGFGLSYTSFEFTDASFSIEGSVLKGQCSVRNTGNRDGAEVVQMYVGFGNSKIDRPVKILRGFSRVELKAGETKKVEIICPVEKLAYYDSSTSSMVLENMQYEAYIGSSADKKDLLEGSFTISNPV